MSQKEHIKRWKSHIRYTLKVLEAMPEENFDFKPADGMKSFQSQASHITTWLRTQSRFVTGESLEKADTKSKRAILEAFNNFSEALLNFLKNTNEETLGQTEKVWYGTVSKNYILQAMESHLAHHRGQMIVYLRLKGITPPSYVV